MLLVAYWHGLMASEVVDLRWDQIELASAALHVCRVKRGTSGAHPILGDELRALRRLQREQEPKSPFAPISTAGFARMVERANGPPGLRTTRRHQARAQALGPWF
jgi:integrase